MADSPLESLRAICLALPEVSERLSHEDPTWFIREKKVLAMYKGYREALWCPAAPGAQEILVDADPARFFRPPYVGHRGWLGIRLDVAVDWDEIRMFILDAYRLVAPRQLLVQLDASAPNPDPSV